MGNYEIGKKIKGLRENNGFTQEQMAEALSMSRQRYMRLENGRTDISYRMLIDIKNLMDVSMQSIIAEENKPSKTMAVLYREKSDAHNEGQNVDKIEGLLKTLFAHEKLYYETHGDEYETE